MTDLTPEEALAAALEKPLQSVQDTYVAEDQHRYHCGGTCAPKVAAALTASGYAIVRSDDLAGLRALSDAATPGPWKHYTQDRWNGGDICRADAPYECATTSGPDGDISQDDADFIVAAVNWVRSALEGVSR